MGARPAASAAAGATRSSGLTTTQTRVTWLSAREDLRLDTAGFLVRERTAIVSEAEETLARLHERHYRAMDASEVRERLEVLFDLVVDAVSERNLSRVIAYA